MPRSSPYLLRGFLFKASCTIGGRLHKQRDRGLYS
nr:MAG TPA: hypothetical protein [Caudoviricetes sp.]